MIPKIRIGAVNYLNTKPLIFDLEKLVPEAEIILDYPSRLADRLHSHDLDVALIPMVEYFRAEDYRLVQDIGISSHGPVLSVTLFSRVPWASIRTIALDEGSRTSAALAQIILRLRYDMKPALRPLPLDADLEAIEADAVLLIGDRAMRACLPGYAYAYDLGQEWHDWTGLPFVYAAWAVRAGVDLGPVEAALAEAKRRGMSQIGPIAAQEAPRLGLDAGYCRRYLTNIIHFDLGDRELAGLCRFHQLATELGLARHETEVEFYRGQALATAEI